MRALVIAGVMALSAAACAPAEEQDVMSEGCQARVAAAWATDADPNASIEAITTGPDCARSVATLIIRNGSGEPQYSTTYIPAHVMTLAQAHDTAAMQTALTEWIDPASNTTMQTTSALPEWPANAELPQNGEFPFYPETDVTRDIYNSYRERNLPMYCYVQGMESQACLTWDADSLVLLGVQSFPG